MAKRLNDKEKKKIIADYINTGNYRETARMNNVTDDTVRRLVKSDNKKVVQKLEQKQEKNTKDILEYMDSIAEKQKKIIDLSLEALEKKLENPDMFTNVKDIATVYGVIFDKALKYKELKSRTNNENEKVSRINIINDLPKDEENDN